MDIEVSFGIWLEKRRKALDLTRKELAQKVGCSVSALRKIETDERHPSKQLAELLANTLVIPTEERATFIKIARGEISFERMKSSPPLPDLSLLQPPQTLSNSIPIPPTPLIGRERELAALHQMLGDPQCRLITLVGPGGIGKTRLAIQVATEQRQAFARGVAFISLAKVTSPNFVIPAIADVLKFAFFGVGDPKTQLLNYLSKKELLLVLDNFEHLMEGFGLVTEILDYAPDVKLVITSREPLNLHGEWVFEVLGLPIPVSAQSTEFEANSAIRLFAQSAGRVQVGYEVTEEEHLAIMRICRLVEGMPLGIELAAAWIRTLSCAEIAGEIEHSLDFLSASARDMPERHRSLRAVFDHSWILLHEDERRTLRHLSVFRGGFTREAAEQVAEATLPILSALVSKSLLYRTEAGRYDLHEFIRQCAAAYLLQNPHESDTVHLQYCLYYTDLVVRLDTPFKSARWKVALKELIVEIDNIRTSWQWALEHNKINELCRMSPCLFWFYETRSLFQEGEAAYQRSVTALQGNKIADVGPEHAAGIGHLIGALGWFNFRIGRLQRAFDLLRESLILVDQDHGSALQFYSRAWLGYVTWATGDGSEARRFLTESISIAQTLSSSWHEAIPNTLLGTVAHMQGEYAEAYHLLSEALTFWRASGDPRGIAFVLTSLAATAFTLGNHDEAQLLLLESYALNQEIDDRWGQTYALNLLAQVLCAQNRCDDALPLLQQSLSLSKEISDSLGEVQALIGLGNSFGTLGDDREAWRAYRWACTTALNAQMTPVALGALIGIASLQQKGGLSEQALELLTQVLLHPAASDEIKARAERLRADLEAQLTPQQIEAVKARAQAKTLETAVEEISSADDAG